MPTLASLPHLVAQIDRRKNGPIDPSTIAQGSDRKLWWRCPEARDHVWLSRVKDRALRGHGCPFCAGRAVSITNALSRVAPSVARQWHPTRNGDLRPRDVVAHARRRVWWKCPRGSDHVWSAPIEQRVRGTGCPFCAGRQPSAERNLAVFAPHLVAEWHPTKNGALRPEEVLPKSLRKVWWQCARGHAWAARPAGRTSGRGCPFCARNLVTPETSLLAVYPAIAEQWHPTKNGQLTPRDVTASSNRRVWWRCPKGPDHAWEGTVAMRLGRGCPFCSGKRASVTNALSRVSPHLAAQWHPTKNGALGPDDVTTGTDRRVWWRCPEGPDHEWEAAICDRKASNGCPFCSNKRVSVTNALATVAPRVASEWHPTKNGTLTPHDLTPGAHRKVWWRCPFGHTWQAMVKARTRLGTGCPDCHALRRRKKVVTTGKRRRPVHLAAYEGPLHGPVRRVR